MERGSGATTKQMQEAPQGAVFIWVNGHFDYPRALANRLNRDDLKIVSPSWLETGQCRGIRCVAVILDHAATPTNLQLDELKELWGRAAPNVYVERNVMRF